MGERVEIKHVGEEVSGNPVDRLLPSLLPPGMGIHPLLRTCHLYPI